MYKVDEFINVKWNNVKGDEKRTNFYEIENYHKLKKRPEKTFTSNCFCAISQKV